MRKQLLFILCVILPMIANAGEIVVDGIKYSYDTSTHQAEVISNSYSGSIVIPSEVCIISDNYAVTSIGEWAFLNCLSLTSVTIPNSVTSIGDYAFYYCSSLTSIAIPNSVTSIGDYAFYYCSGLTSIAIPNSVTSIGSNAFYKCYGLTSITIGNSVTSIGDYAFYGCSGIKEVHCYTDKVPETSSNAFNNSNISQATLYVPYIYELLDSYKNAEPWKNFKEIVGEGIGIDDIYYGIISTSSATVVNSPEQYSGKVVIPTSVTFDGVEYSVTAISADAFKDCKDLTSVTIPNSVTSIGSSAFSGCSSLTSITIPNSVTSIGDGAFSCCI